MDLVDMVRFGQHRRILGQPNLFLPTSHHSRRGGRLVPARHPDEAHRPLHSHAQGVGEWCPRDDSYSFPSLSTLRILCRW